MSQMNKDTEAPNFLVVQEDIIENKTHTWRKKSNNKKGFTEVPISSLSDKHLQNAYNTACAKELYYHNKTMVFSQLTEVIQEEAERRQVILQEYDTEFHKNKNKILKRENVIK